MAVGGSLCICSVSILRSQAQPFLKVLSAFPPQWQTDNSATPATWDYLLTGRSPLGRPWSSDALPKFSCPSLPQLQHLHPLPLVISIPQPFSLLPPSPELRPWCDKHMQNHWNQKFYLDSAEAESLKAGLSHSN